MVREVVFLSRCLHKMFFFVLALISPSLGCDSVERSENRPGFVFIWRNLPWNLHDRKEKYVNNRSNNVNSCHIKSPSSFSASSSWRLNWMLPECAPIYMQNNLAKINTFSCHQVVSLLGKDEFLRWISSCFPLLKRIESLHRIHENGSIKSTYIYPFKSDWYQAFQRYLKKSMKKKWESSFEIWSNIFQL